jgi:hypothetical protein
MLNLFFGDDYLEKELEKLKNELDEIKKIEKKRLKMQEQKLARRRKIEKQKRIEETEKKMLEAIQESWKHSEPLTADNLERMQQLTEWIRDGYPEINPKKCRICSEEMLAEYCYISGIKTEFWNWNRAYREIIIIWVCLKCGHRERLIYEKKI